VKITVDTNVLPRAFLADEPAQHRVGTEALEAADLAAVSLQSLCEFVWVLDRALSVARQDIAGAIRAVFDIQNVVVNRPAVGSGLQLLETGGDFADGVIADDGRWRGGDIFVSFDRKFVRLLLDQGQQAQPLE
jgi:predicted nucleic-acid-binding protein